MAVCIRESPAKSAANRPERHPGNRPATGESNTPTSVNDGSQSALPAVSFVVRFAPSIAIPRAAVPHAPEAPGFHHSLATSTTGARWDASPSTKQNKSFVFGSLRVLAHGALSTSGRLPRPQIVTRFRFRCTFSSAKSHSTEWVSDVLLSRSVAPGAVKHRTWPRVRVTDWLGDRNLEVVGHVCQILGTRCRQDAAGRNTR